MKEVLVNYYCDACKRMLSKNENTGSIIISEVVEIGCTLSEEIKMEEVCNNCINSIRTLINKLEK